MTPTDRPDGWPSFRAMAFLRLEEGPADGEEMEIAPTMRNLTVRGERYFRIDKMRAKRGDEYGGAYLWDGWRPSRAETDSAAAPVAANLISGVPLSEQEGQ